MNSKGFYEVVNALRGRSWTTAEALELKLYIDTGTKVLPKMNKVTHILITAEEVTIPNPYYSIGNRGIESETIKEFQQKVHHFYNEDEFFEYLIKNPSTVSNPNKYSYYKVEQLFPKITTTVNIDV